MMWTNLRFRFSVLGLSLLAASAGQATAGLAELSTDRFGYTGTYTRYETLADAQNGTGAVGGGDVVQRDVSLYIVNDSPQFYSDATYLQTAWWYSTISPGNNNPSNTNLSFAQLVNDPAAGYPSLSGTADAYWTSSALNELRITASGTGVTRASRFGDEGSANKVAAATNGLFLSYSLDATFSGLNTATYNPSTGAYESYGDPDGITVAGTFSALFQNTSATNPELNGFYTIELTFNNNSWVYLNQDSLVGAYPDFPSSVFGAATVVPEPSSLVLAGLGALGAAAGVVRRRRAS